MKIVSEIRGISDPYSPNKAITKRTLNANQLTEDTLSADVIIIGTGAGGGTSAEIFAQAGLKVLMIEEGPLKSTRDFKMDESQAYADLYQEGAGRVTKDGGIGILQGRCVGGTTVVNWTSSFRTPSLTLDYWQKTFQVKGCSKEDMLPWFEKMEKRLHILPWQGGANENNTVLKDGCDKLNIPWKVIPRNVKGCWNLGYCGMGCPTNAKQSMLVTTIPEALEHGATLLYQARVERLLIKNNKVTGVECFALDNSKQKTSKKIVATAPYVILACGGINGPALMLRSKAPDPNDRIGKRTFLHPTVFSFAQFDHEISPFYGAPQSIYSDHFQWENGAKGPLSYKLEVPPLHPAMTSIMLMGHGDQQVADIAKLNNTHAMLALLRDGFDDESEGASITLSDDGSPIIDYPMNDYLFDGIKRAYLSMAKVQFAAGAKKVRPAHQHGQWFNSYEAFKAGFKDLEHQISNNLVGSAHVMGGLAMGENKTVCLVDSDCKYHYLDNLWVFDGSVFPTSIGTNPQLSIYALVCKQATVLANKLRSKSVI
ncbi:MAG: GMC family oxidoreductase [Colwellia sp.]|nr:GMC family oxidoreductase [Colwellia sp.]